MRSETTRDFWKLYAKLSVEQKEAARKSYRLWADDPFHPSLRFKCINASEHVWSVRITRSFRALCVLENDLAIWFWIGSHDEYERFFGA